MTQTDEQNIDDAKFEVSLRILGNEIIALSITADPFNRRWVAWGLAITLGVLFTVLVLREPIIDLYQGLTGTSEIVQTKE